MKSAVSEPWEFLGEMMTLKEALLEISAAAPLMLNAESEQPVEGKPTKLTFPDDHRMTVAVSAGCLRAIRKAMGAVAVKEQN